MGSFETNVLFWRSKFLQQGKSYVGRRGEDFNLQTKKIEALLRAHLSVNDFYPHGLDMGCGWGRFIPLLSNFCGHLWAVDIVEEAMRVIPTEAITTTAVLATHPLKLPFPEPAVDLLWCCMYFQCVVDDEVFNAACSELKRTLRPGARVLIIDNQADRNAYVRARGPEVLAKALELASWKSDKAVINIAPGDHFILDGVK